MAVEAVIFQQIVDMNWDQAIYTASPNNTINVAQFAAKGSGTNIGIALTPKGTGYISAQVPDGTVAGGNARGANSVDWQTQRDAATGVASSQWSTISGGRGNDTFGAGTYATIGGGQGNAARAVYSSISGGIFNYVYGESSSCLGGTNNYSGGKYSSTIGGYRALARREGMVAHASGFFSAIGDCQSFTHEMRCKTTTNAAVEMFIDGSSVRLVLDSNMTINCLIEITGIKSDGSASASYHRQVEIKRIGNATTLVKNEVVGVDNASGTLIAITADDTNEALKITATGIASETWRWMATIRGSEMGMGA
jgi:hypothetical protein